MPFSYSTIEVRNAAIAAAEAANGQLININPGTTIYVKGSNQPYLILARVRAIEEVPEIEEPRGCRDWG